MGCFRMEQRIGMGYGMSICSAADVDACAGACNVEESGCECGCIVADYAVHHALPDRGVCF